MNYIMELSVFPESGGKLSPGSVFALNIDVKLIVHNISTLA